jgi:hypothetical protein
MEGVGVVKMLLAADHGKHNMGDASWWADGAGFDAFNSAAGNLIGPLWPGKQYIFPNLPSNLPPLPIGNFIRSALLTSGDPAWGFQVTLLLKSCSSSHWQVCVMPINHTPRAGIFCPKLRLNLCISIHMGLQVITIHVGPLRLFQGERVTQQVMSHNADALTEQLYS